MRKYFNEKDGYDLMYGETHPDNVMMKTFNIEKNIYKLALPWDQYDVTLKYYNLGGWGKIKSNRPGKDGYEHVTTTVEETRINHITNIHESEENIYETNTKVNRLHRHGKGGKGTGGVDITVEGVEEDDTESTKLANKRALEKHSHIKGH